MAHYSLPGYKISTPLSHKSVEEIWYIISGEGEMWLKSLDNEEVIPLSPGVCLTIHIGNHFQFRNLEKAPLCILISTMPSWLGPEEAVVVDGYW